MTTKGLLISLYLVSHGFRNDVHTTPSSHASSYCFLRYMAGILPLRRTCKTQNNQSTSLQCNNNGDDENFCWDVIYVYI